MVGVSSVRCFNGAATFRLRKATTGWTACRRVARFNGAATFRLRKVGAGAECPSSKRCFNGAATFRLRKAIAMIAILRSLEALQWGRNLSVAEGCSCRTATPAR